MERNPTLSLRKGDSTANARMSAMDNKEAIERYFTILEDVLTENNLADKPSQIYNVDESGMPLDHHPPRILVKKGQRKVRYRTSGNKSQVTVVGCVNAAGSSIPPFVIFDAKSLNMEWTKGEVPGTTYGLSSNGWIDMDLFKGWLTNHFLQHAVSARPLLLLMDGHSSHYNPEAIHIAKENNVILFTLIPHTTHEMQPMDTSVFGPLKAHWKNACHEFMQNNPGKVVTKYQFSPLLNQAWLKTMTPSVIINGFRYCGVYPLNSQAIFDRCETVSGFTAPNSAPSCSTTSVVEETFTEDCSQSAATSVIEDCSQAAATSVIEDCSQAAATSVIEDCSQAEGGVSFYFEENQKFQRKYDECCDIFDQRYVLWLEKYHPNTSVQPSPTSVQPSPTSVQPSPTSVQP